MATEEYEIQVMAASAGLAVFCPSTTQAELDAMLPSVALLEDKDHFAVVSEPVRSILPANKTVVRRAVIVHRFSRACKIQGCTRTPGVEHTVHRVLALHWRTKQLCARAGGATSCPRPATSRTMQRRLVASK